jgi:hypothetical protein
VARNQRGSDHRSRLDLMRFHFYLPPFTKWPYRHPSLHPPAPEPVRVQHRSLGR